MSGATPDPDRQSHPSTAVAIAIGGALGTLTRMLVLELAPPVVGRWPWATFAVNVCGAALLGLAVAGGTAGGPRSVVRHRLIGTGFCGALTTFSAVQLELLDMLDAGRLGTAITYAGGTLAAGLLAVWAASRIARGRARGAVSP